MDRPTSSDTNLISQVSAPFSPISTFDFFLSSSSFFFFFFLGNVLSSIKRKWTTEYVPVSLLLFFLHSIKCINGICIIDTCDLIPKKQRETIINTEEQSTRAMLWKTLYYKSKPLFFPPKNLFSKILKCDYLAYSFNSININKNF